MFRTPLWPSSGAQEYYTVVAACGIWCFVFKLLVWCGAEGYVSGLQDAAASYKMKNYHHLTPNGHYMGRTAQLTSRCCILYIYSTNIRTEYFKHAA